MSGSVKTPSGFTSVLPLIRTPKIKRANLRKYSWLPDVFRIKGSIIPQIFGPVFTITLFAVLVTYVSTLGYKLVVVNSIVPMLSVVVGLILVFRNSTSYDRYWEGRRSFAGITSSTRNLARMIWIGVALPPTEAQPANTKGKTPTTDVTHSQLRKKKVEALRLCLSFAFATKHYLRGEDGVNWADYQGVLPASFARVNDGAYSCGTHRSYGTGAYAATGNDYRDTSLSRDASGRTSPELDKPDATKRVRVKRSKQQLSDHSTPLLADARDAEAFGYHEEVSLPLPLIIAHQLSRTIFDFRREGFLETVGPAGMNGLTQMVSALVDQLTAMERVANTPIPISYSIHLKQCVTLYLFALPLTLVNDLGWATVPVMTAVAFTFMGIEGIADEIEMPFGTDKRDLPLNRYCQDLKEEIYYIIERLPEGGEGLHGYDDGEGDD